MGAGNDTVAISQATLQRDLILLAGQGANEVQGSNTSVAGSLLVKAGAGDDTIDLTGTTAASVTVDADGGTNTLTIP